MMTPRGVCGTATVYLSLVSAGALAPMVSAWAEPFDYTERAFASFTLAGVYFDSEVTITVAADTSGITQPAPGIFAVSGIGSVAVAGGATAIFTDELTAFANNTVQGLGITDISLARDVLDTVGVAGGPYDLSVAIGPLSGHAELSPLTSFETDLGIFSLGAATTSSFSAAPQAVPEPASMAILALGASMVPLLRRRQRHTA